MSRKYFSGGFDAAQIAPLINYARASDLPSESPDTEIITVNCAMAAQAVRARESSHREMVPIDEEKKSKIIKYLMSEKEHDIEDLARFGKALGFSRSDFWRVIRELTEQKVFRLGPEDAPRTLTSFLETYHEDGTPTGKVKEYWAIKDDRDWLMATNIFIFNSEGRLFLQVRRDGTLDSSIGGSVDLGLDAREGAIAEAKEEFDLDVRTSDLKPVGNLKRADGLFYYNFDTNIQKEGFDKKGTFNAPTYQKRPVKVIKQTFSMVLNPGQEQRWRDHVGKNIISWEDFLKGKRVILNDEVSAIVEVEPKVLLDYYSIPRDPTERAKIFSQGLYGELENDGMRNMLEKNGGENPAMISAVDQRDIIDLASPDMNTRRTASRSISDFHGPSGTWEPVLVNNVIDPIGVSEAERSFEELQRKGLIDKTEVFHEEDARRYARIASLFAFALGMEKDEYDYKFWETWATELNHEAEEWLARNSLESVSSGTADELALIRNYKLGQDSNKVPPEFAFLENVRLFFLAQRMLANKEVQFKGLGPWVYSSINAILPTHRLSPLAKSLIFANQAMSNTMPKAMAILNMAQGLYQQRDRTLNLDYEYPDRSKPEVMIKEELIHIVFEEARKFAQESGLPVKLFDPDKIIFQIAGSASYLTDPENRVYWPGVDDIDVFVYVPDRIQKTQFFRDELKLQIENRLRKIMPKPYEVVIFSQSGLIHPGVNDIETPYRPDNIYIGKHEEIQIAGLWAEIYSQHKISVLKEYSDLFERYSQKQEYNKKLKILFRLAQMRGDGPAVDSLFGFIRDAYSGSLKQENLSSFEAEAKPDWDSAQVASKYSIAITASHAMVTTLSRHTGGIDLTSAKMNLQTQNSGGEDQILSRPCHACTIT